MIQPLRRWHFQIWVALAIALPLIVAVALWFRRDTVLPNPGLHWETVR